MPTKGSYQPCSATGSRGGGRGTDWEQSGTDRLSLCYFLSVRLIRVGLRSFEHTIFCNAWDQRNSEERWCGSQVCQVYSAADRSVGCTPGFPAPRLQRAVLRTDRRCIFCLSCSFVTVIALPGLITGLNFFI